MKRKSRVSKTDYTKDMLPQNRKAVFLDAVQLQWRNLLLLGLILLVFAIPLLLSSLTEDVYVSNFLETFNATASEQQAGAAYALAYWEIGRGLVNTLLLALFAVGLSGVCRVLRQYAWGENVHVPTDFVKGVKDNWKQTVLLGFLMGLIYTLCLIVLYFSSGYASGFVSALSMLPIAISILLILPVFSICLVMVPVYTNTFGAYFKNALYVYTKNPFRTLLVMLCCATIWIPTVIPNVYCHLFGGILAVLLLPFVLLAWTLFCYDRFDKYINRDICPELVNRGIFPTESNQEE